MIRIGMFLGIVLLLGSVFLIGGCSSGNPDKEHDLVGWIDSIQQPQGQTPGQILVNSPDNDTSDKFTITVTTTTIIHKIAGDEEQEIGFSNFIKGQKVEVWFSGPVMESYPAQVSAEKVLVTEEPASPTMPPLDDGVRGILLEVSCEEFAVNPHIIRSIEITYPGSLVVSLCANPTTGFEWEEVKIGNESVINQTERNYVSPEATGVVGASGKDVWSFNSGSRGQSTLIFEYSRPWEGGEKNEWTFELTVVVK